MESPGEECYNPFVCDFEYIAAGGPFPAATARYNFCDSLFSLDANALKDHVTLAHAEQLPPAYFKSIVGLNARIPGHGSAAVKPSGCVLYMKGRAHALQLTADSVSRSSRKTVFVPRTVTKQRTKEHMMVPPIPAVSLQDIECETATLTWLLPQVDCVQSSTAPRPWYTNTSAKFFLKAAGVTMAMPCS
jgi:hypothetical protein